MSTCSLFLNGLFTLATFVGDNASDSDKCLDTCLARLGQYDSQGKYIQCDIAGIIMHDIALNIANVNSA